MKQQVVVFSLGALAAFGAAGWLRSLQPVPVVPTSFQSAQRTAVAPPADAPVVLDEPVFEERQMAPAPVWREEVAPVRARRASQRTVRSAVLTSDQQDIGVESRPVPADEPRLKQRETRRPDEESAQSAEPKLRQRDSSNVELDPVETQRDPSVSQPSSASRQDPVIRERSKKASAAIIAGSAAAGAAIGAAAGRGKGAAIGAITGAAGGYVYDRMTHRKRETPDPQDSTVRDTSGYRDSDTQYGDEDTKVDTLKRVGVGAASGAAIGGIAGRGRGAAIGAITGGAAGYIYDRIKRR